MTDGRGKGVTVGMSAEQRARDGRLAWIIVGICAVLSLTIIVLGILALRGPAVRWAEEAQMQADARERERLGFPPLSVPDALAPPSMSTATPVGDPANWIGPGDYPVGARVRGEEGRVSVTVSVDPQGRATGCQTHQSSGFGSLDAGTCHVMMTNGVWEAAPGEYGVRRWTSPPVRWQLPE